MFNVRKACGCRSPVHFRRPLWVHLAWEILQKLSSPQNNIKPPGQLPKYLHPLPPSPPYDLPLLPPMPSPTPTPSPTARPVSFGLLQIRLSPGTNQHRIGDTETLSVLLESPWYYLQAQALDLGYLGNYYNQEIKRNYKHVRFLKFSQIAPSLVDRKLHVPGWFLKHAFGHSLNVPF